jgi:hypothetical protein
LWAAFVALINEANGVGGPSSTAPIGFLNPTLYQLASASSSNFQRYRGSQQQRLV